MRFSSRAYDGRVGASTTLLALSLLVVQTACARTGPPQPPVVTSVTDLTNALAEAGVDAVWAGEAVSPALPIRGGEYLVDRARIQVYEFESLDERRALSEAIDKQGAIQGIPLAAWQGRPSIWTAGRLIVLYPGLEGGTVLLLSGLLGDPLTIEAPAQDEPYPPAVLAAIGALAERSDIAPGNIDVVRYEPVDWPNSCLGLPQPDEACAEAITPGWLIVLLADSQSYEFHSDELGQVLRER